MQIAGSPSKKPQGLLVGEGVRKVWHDQTTTAVQLRQQQKGWALRCMQSVQTPYWITSSSWQKATQQTLGQLV